MPNSPLDIAWTNYGTGNVSTSDVRAIIDGSTTINKTLAFGEYIGQHNNGNHTALYGDVDTYLSGKDVPVADRRRERQLRGLVDVPRDQRRAAARRRRSAATSSSSFESARLSITGCSANNCPRYLGSYILKLTN